MTHTQVGVIQTFLQEKTKERLANLTQDQKDAFILEKLNKANDEFLNIIGIVDNQISHRLERIRAELTLGVEVPELEKMTAEDIMAFVKPFVENMVECTDKLREDQEYDMAMHQMQPIKQFSRS